MTVEMQNADSLASDHMVATAEHDIRRIATLDHTDWIEKARQAYLRRWWAENGDNFDISINVYEADQ